MLQHEGDNINGYDPIPMNKKGRSQQTTMDLISDLPDPIIHHIMSFLTPMEVTSLSILSRRFFSLWASFPIIEFDETSFSRTYHGTDSFLQHVLNSFFRRAIKTTLSQFRVKANLAGIMADRRLDLVISNVLAYGVRSMELNLGFAEYRLPNDFACRSIHVLRLKGLQLNPCNLIQLCPNLKTVCLKSCVIVHDNKQIITSKTLTEIELQYCEVNFIKINSPNLQSFLFRSGKLNPQSCQIDVLKCQNITYLSLNNLANGRDWIEEHVQSLSNLNTFILSRCRDIEHIHVCNDNLERVELVRCPMLTSIELHAKSLESFVYNRASSGRACNTIAFLGSTKCIKDLSIKGAAFVTDQWLDTHLARMTNLETLRLIGCSRLKKINLFHEKLQTLELNSCHNLVEADINTPKLVSFMYDHGEVVINPHGRLITDEWLELQLAKMASLESLRLKGCGRLKKVKVLHEKLRFLELDSCNGVVEAEIETPQLVSFVYRGKIIEFVKMVTGSNCSATLCMNRWVAYYNETFWRWRKLLSFFGHCKALKLICNTPQEVMMPELHRERLVSPLFDLQHLDIQIEALEKIDIDLLDSLLWLSPLPGTLHVSSGSHPHLQMIIKFVYSDMMEGEEEDKNPLCCGTKPIKCWKHHLKGLEVQSSEVYSKTELTELKKYFLTNTNIPEPLLIKD